MEKVPKKKSKSFFSIKNEIVSFSTEKLSKYCSRDFWDLESDLFPKKWQKEKEIALKKFYKMTWQYLMSL